MQKTNLWDEVWHQLSRYKACLNMEINSKVELSCNGRSISKAEADSQLSTAKERTKQALDDLKRTAVSYIMQELCVEEQRAQRIFDFCYAEKHSNSWEEVLVFMGDLVSVLSD